VENREETDRRDRVREREERYIDGRNRRRDKGKRQRAELEGRDRGEKKG
jgi:hypothetical protein